MDVCVRTYDFVQAYNREKNQVRELIKGPEILVYLASFMQGIPGKQGRCEAGQSPGSFRVIQKIF